VYPAFIKGTPYGLMDIWVQYRISLRNQVIMFVQIAWVPLPATPLDQESRYRCLTGIQWAANPEGMAESSFI